jgi:hypothetical protein
VSNSTIQFVGERDKNRFVGVKFKNSWYNTDLKLLLVLGVICLRRPCLV